MVVKHKCFQPLIQHMRIDFRRGDIGVAQHGLDRAQIGPTGQQMCCKGVAQGMWRDLGRGHATGDGKFLDQAKKAMPGQMP